MEMTRTTQNGDLTLTLKGAFTFEDNMAFRSILAGISNTEVKHITFNLEHVHFIDSAALGMLLLAYDESLRHQKRIILRGAGGQVSKTLHMAHFENYFVMQ